MSKKPEHGKKPSPWKVVKGVALEMFQGKKKERQHSGNFLSTFWYITAAVYLDDNHAAWFLFKKTKQNNSHLFFKLDVCAN